MSILTMETFGIAACDPHNRGFVSKERASQLSTESDALDCLEVCLLRTPYRVETCCCDAEDSGRFCLCPEGSLPGIG